MPLDQIDPHQSTIMALSAMLAARRLALWRDVLETARVHHPLHRRRGGRRRAGGGQRAHRLGKLLDIVSAWVLTPIGGAVLGYVLYQLLRLLVLRRLELPDRIWVWPLTLSGMYMAFSWGANDVANATGLMVGVGMMSPFQAALLGGSPSWSASLRGVTG